MKAHYKPSVEDRIRNICRDADASGEELDFISLTRPEWDKIMVSKYVHVLPGIGSRGAVNNYTIFGVPIVPTTMIGNGNPYPA